MRRAPLPLRPTFVLASVPFAGAALGGGAPVAFPGNDSSYSPAISADGRYVAYMSLASNLVPGDTNGVFDIFVLDRQLDTVTRVSTNPFGGQADGQSWAPAISPDGRYVAFASNATNLVQGDTNAAGDVFRKDLVTAAVVRVSVGDDESEATGGSGPRDDANVVSITRNGRFVTFQSCLNGLDGGGCGGILRDLVDGTTRRFSNELYARPAVGARDVPGGVEVSIAFTTPASLVASDTNVCLPGQSTCQDVYLARTTVPSAGAPTAFAYRRVSTAPGDSNPDDTSGTDNVGRGVSISEDGRRIAFVTEATNLLPGDANGELDAYYYVAGPDAASSVLTRETNGIALLAASLSFPSVAAMLSPDGNFMLYFDTDVANDGDWIIKQVPGGATQQIGRGSPVPGTRLEEVGHGAVSDGGLVAAWQTPIFDLPGTRYDTRSDIFVSAGAAGRTTSLASQGRIGSERDGHSRVGALSGDGTRAAFSSFAWNFEGTDTGANRDVFVKTLATGVIVRASSLFQPTDPVDAYWPDLSDDGNEVVFVGTGTPNAGTCSDGFGRAWFVSLQPALTMQCLDGDASGYTGVLAEPFPQPTVSDDGNWAAFGGFANGQTERKLFLRDLVNGTLERVEVLGAVRFENGTIQLSGDGRYLVHSVDPGAIAFYDRVTDADTVVSRFVDGGGLATGPISSGTWPSISADGSTIAFVSDRNLTNESPAPRGEQVFVHDRATQALTRLTGDSVGRNDGTFKARTRLSADGRYVAYVIDDLCTFRCASDTNGVTDVMFALEGNGNGPPTTTLVSASTGGTPSNGPSAQADIDGDARFVTFASLGNNLTAGDTNNTTDIFMRDLTANQTVLLSVGQGGVPANGPARTRSATSSAPHRPRHRSSRSRPTRRTWVASISTARPTSTRGPRVSACSW